MMWKLVYSTLRHTVLRCDLHFIQPLCGGGGGAVGGDIGPPLRIAHRDRKSAEIGANDANHALRSAG